MDQELMYKASMLEEQINKLDEHLAGIDRQATELTQFKNSISSLKEIAGKELISSLGKGVYLKTKATENKLFVEVGAGILIRKTPDEAVKIIEEQIIKLNEAKVHFMGQKEILIDNIQATLKEIEDAQKKHSRQD